MYERDIMSLNILEIIAIIVLGGAVIFVMKLFTLYVKGRIVFKERTFKRICWQGIIKDFKAIKEPITYK
jgi:hypothetical protein